MFLRGDGARHQLGSAGSFNYSIDAFWLLGKFKRLVFIGTGPICSGLGTYMHRLVPSLTANGKLLSYLEIFSHVARTLVQTTVFGKVQWYDVG